MLHGLPTTKTLAVRLALSFINLPVSMNILAFYFKRSPLSYPGPLGLDPTNNA